MTYIKTFIHGHNHRYIYAHTTTPKTSYRITRIGVPTLSTRNAQFERGFLQWSLKDMEQQVLPVLISQEHFEKQE